MALEYGTYSREEMRAALQADNWLHAYGDPTASDAAAIKKQIRDAFYVDDDVWKAMVLAQSFQAIKQGLRGLLGT